MDGDKDGIPDSIDEDDDNDGIPDDKDAFPHDPGEWLDTDSDGIGNNADDDDDGDGFGDKSEIEAGTDPLNGSSNVDFSDIETGLKGGAGSTGFGIFGFLSLLLLRRKFFKK